MICPRCKGARVIAKQRFHGGFQVWENAECPRCLGQGVLADRRFDVKHVVEHEIKSVTVKCETAKNDRE